MVGSALLLRSALWYQSRCREAGAGIRCKRAFFTFGSFSAKQDTLNIHFDVKPTAVCVVPVKLKFTRIGLT